MAEIIDFNDKKSQYQNLKKSQLINEQTQEQKVLSQFVKCPKCGGYRYTDMYLLKVVTPFENPELQTSTVMPILLYACASCGKIADIQNLNNGE